jgi:hypothetical protein
MINKPDILDAIISLQPDYKVSVNNSNDKENFEVEWYDYTPISKADIQAKYDELITKYNNSDYARKRKLEYPSLEDQLDYIYHNGITKWKSDIVKPIKEKYPKE